jgi:predicted dienelactone hydrolase
MCRRLAALLPFVLAASLAGPRAASAEDAGKPPDPPPPAAKAARDESAAYKLKDGPFAVEEIEDLVLRDEKRSKDLHVRIRYPKGDGPFPVIVFSHGFGAGKEAFAPVSRHWAGHGYVVIHPQHADGGALGGAGGPAGGSGLTPERREALRQRFGGSPAAPAGGSSGGSTDKETPVEKQVPAGDAAEPKPGANAQEPPGGGADRRRTLGRTGAGGMMGDPQRNADRVRDVTFVLDALDAVEDKVPALKGKLDRTRIGVGGHSYGAFTSLLIGGVTVNAGGEKSRSFADARVKCVLTVSAAGTGEYGLTKESWKGAKGPALYVTGTRDVRPGHDAAWRKEPFNLSPAGDKYLVILDGATHFDFGGGSQGGTSAARGGAESGGGSPSNRRPAGGRFGGGRFGVASRAGQFAPYVHSATLAFWDAYLKGSAEAKTHLQTDGGFVKFAGGAATLAAK